MKSIRVAMLVGMLAAGPAAAADTAAEAASQRDAAWVEKARRSLEALEWTDHVVRHDWRLQHHYRGAAARILDPDDQVIAAGSSAECRAAFTELQRSARVPAVRGRTVILLHGLGEGRRSMQPLAAHLRHALDATVVCFGYASVKADIDAHGRALASVVADLKDADRISFVGHSLGSLVVRRWMALAAPTDLARAERVVMLGPPNQGSDLAKMAAKIWGVASRAQGAARDLVVDWPRVAPQLAVPTCGFGIIAGGRGDDAGFSPLLDGDDDAVVRVAETRLDGADDFLLVPVHHAAMMRHADVQRATGTFLETGRFPPGAAAGE